MFKDNPRFFATLFSCNKSENSIILAIIFISDDYIALTMFIAEVWDCTNITKSEEARNKEHKTCLLRYQQGQTLQSDIRGELFCYNSFSISFATKTDCLTTSGGASHLIVKLGSYFLLKPNIKLCELEFWKNNPTVFPSVF